MAHVYGMFEVMFNICLILSDDVRGNRPTEIFSGVFPGCASGVLTYRCRIILFAKSLINCFAGGNNNQSDRVFFNSTLVCMANGICIMQYACVGR